MVVPGASNTGETMAGSITDMQALASRCAAGDVDAYNTLFDTIYQDLRRRAHYLLSRRSGSATLCTTALVHDTYLKLAGANLAPNDREHFFAIAARAMRQVLANAARDRVAIKRGGDLRQVTLDTCVFAVDVPQDVIKINDAMEALAATDARLARVVDLHFFAGIEFAEIAQLLRLSERTVARDWRAARATLLVALSEDGGHG